MTGHNFKKTIAGKQYCTGCGLVLLRNALTEWCVKRGCDYADDRGYQQALANLPAQHRGES